jgi:hypothetical protein
MAATIWLVDGTSANVAACSFQANLDSGETGIGGFAGLQAGFQTGEGPLQLAGCG